MLGVLCAGETLKQVISEVRGRRQAHVSVDRVSHKVGWTQTVSFRLFYNNLGAAAVTALQFPVTDLIFATLQVGLRAVVPARRADQPVENLATMSGRRRASDEDSQGTQSECEESE